MNPSTPYMFTSRPTECSYVDSQSYIQSTGSESYTVDGIRVPKNPLYTVSSKIHINPKMCAPRSIYINKALIGNNIHRQVATSATCQKTERVHYNPKFFKSTGALTNTVPSNLNTSSTVPAKLEGKIHVNPNFIRKDAITTSYQTSNSETIVHQSKTLLEPVVVTSGIHVNPAFLQGYKMDSPQQPDVHKLTESTNKQKYVSKYKVCNKMAQGLTKHVSNLKKTNLKRLNIISPRRTKYKFVKGKVTSPIPSSQKVLYKNKYSLARVSLKTKVAANTNKRSSISSLQNVYPRTKLMPTSMSISYKKSVLRQKIEARRRVKSSLNQLTRYNRSYVSKYKYVRSPQKQFRSTYKNNLSKNIYSKTFNSTLELTRSSPKTSSEFKSISRTKLVRKSVLQKQIESRMRARKSDVNISPRNSLKKSGDKVSTYKLIRTNGAVSAIKRAPSSSKMLNLSKKSIKKICSSMKFSSDKYRHEKLRKVAHFTKKLRKNNQPCPFYHRYGRCKAKDRGTCPKLHDPMYIAICKRFLKGDCKDEKCSLSHDIRPGKMPTCHHYLAGLCKRQDCPYLHIKVNQKAPICRSFLQGFCPDVFNCSKRHEYICPMFAEKGQCSRGKSCKLPHRTITIESKLLEQDELPLLRRKRKPRQKKVSITNETVSVDSSVTKDSKPNEGTPDQEIKTKEFKRYFLAPPLDDPSESSDSSENEA